MANNNEQNRAKGAGVNRAGEPGLTGTGAAGGAGNAGAAKYEFGTELAGAAPAGARRGEANRAGNQVPGARQGRPGRE